MSRPTRRSATPPPWPRIRGKSLRRAARRTHRRSPDALPPRLARSGHHPRRQAAHRRAHRRLRHRQRSGAGRAAVPVRPVPDDRLQPSRRPARQSAGPLERFQQARLGQQVHRQHQHRNELLAGGRDQPLRMPPAAVRRAEGTGANPAPSPPRNTTTRAAGCCITTSICGAARRPSTPPITASGRPAARGSPRTSGSTTCSPAIASSCATPPIR